MTLYRPVHDVTIGAYRFHNLDPAAPRGALEQITVSASRQAESDQARVDFPYDAKDLDIHTFHEGDAVTIALGNIPGISAQLVFAGEVAKVGPGVPVWLECRDVLHKLGKKPFSKVFRDVTPNSLGGVLQEIAGDVAVETGEVPPQFNLTRFVCDNHTPRFALRELAKKLGCDFYGIPGSSRVYFGYPYMELALTQTFVPLFRYGLNILDEGTLVYREKSPVGQVVVYGVDGSFKKRTVKGVWPSPAHEGPVRTFERELTTAADAAEEAQRLYAEMSSSRWEGSFTTVGRGDVRHSMRCKIEDPDQPARSLHADVEAVTHNYGTEYTMDVAIAHAD